MSYANAMHMHIRPGTNTSCTFVSSAETLRLYKSRINPYTIGFIFVYFVNLNSTEDGNNIALLRFFKLLSLSILYSFCTI